MNGTSYRVALGGIVSALCLVSMFLTGVVPVLSLTLPMVAGTLMLVIKDEVSTGWAFLTYTSVSLLSLFVAFDKESAVTFIFLFGLYPILKGFFDRLKSRLLRVVCKLAYYDVAITVAFQLTMALFGMEEFVDEVGKYLGEHGLLVVLVASNPVFITYDYVLGNLTYLYYRKLKPKISRGR